jgi:hypothetical protein
MSIKVTTHQVGDVTVVDVVGRITLGEGASTLREIIRDLVSRGSKKVLLILNERSAYVLLMGLPHRLGAAGDQEDFWLSWAR